MLFQVGANGEEIRRCARLTYAPGRVAREGFFVGH